MDDSKIFMFPDCGTKQTNSDVNSLLPYLLMGNGNGMNGGGWLWVIFLFFSIHLCVMVGCLIIAAFQQTMDALEALPIW